MTKKKNNGNKRVTFQDILKRSGAEAKKADGLEENVRISEAQVKRLFKAIEGLKEVNHPEVVIPIETELRRYVHERGEDYGSGINKYMVDMLYTQIYNGLSLVLHISKDGGIADYRIHLKDCDIIPTMNPRIEFMDSVVDLTRTATLEQLSLVRTVDSEMVPENPSLYVYNTQDMALWGAFKRDFNEAIQSRIYLCDESKKRRHTTYEKKFELAVKSGYKNGTRFTTRTHDLISGATTDKLLF